MKPIYLDNAATSFPKPHQVYKEVSQCIKKYCGNPGRSSHSLAIASANKIYECREKIADFFNSPFPENVIFTLNTTYALNMAIKGLVKENDHIIISDMEHNSVYRPIKALEKDKCITFDIFKTIENGKSLSDDEILKSISKKIKKGKTKMLICAHIPNICSHIRPIAKIGELCRKNNIYFIVDAAQSAGHVKIDMQKDKIDVLCAPGHKGLMGIQGIGFMLFSKDILPECFIEGGNGINSLEYIMPDFPPERYESGTLSTPAIASLCEGISYLNKIGEEHIFEHECNLFKLLKNELYNLGNLSTKIYLPNNIGSTMLFNIDNYQSEKIAQYLSKNNICVRGGYHCSALGHRTLDTLEKGGIRISFGPFNTENDVYFLAKVIQKFIIK